MGAPGAAAAPAAPQAAAAAAQKYGWSLDGPKTDDPRIQDIPVSLIRRPLGRTRANGARGPLAGAAARSGRGVGAQKGQAGRPLCRWKPCKWLPLEPASTPGLSRLHLHPIHTPVPVLASNPNPSPIQPTHNVQSASNTPPPRPCPHSPPDQDKVAALMASISEVGLHAPVGGPARGVADG